MRFGTENRKASHKYIRVTRQAFHRIQLLFINSHGSGLPKMEHDIIVIVPWYLSGRTNSISFDGFLYFILHDKMILLVAIDLFTIFRSYPVHSLIDDIEIGKFIQLPTK